MTIIEDLKSIAKSFDYWHDEPDAKTCRDAIRLIEMQEIVIQTARMEIKSLRLQVDLLGEYKWQYESLT